MIWSSDYWNVRTTNALIFVLGSNWGLCSFSEGKKSPPPRTNSWRQLCLTWLSLRGRPGVTFNITRVLRPCLFENLREEISHFIIWKNLTIFINWFLQRFSKRRIILFEKFKECIYVGFIRAAERARFFVEVVQRSKPLVLFYMFSIFCNYFLSWS